MNGFERRQKLLESFRLYFARKADAPEVDEYDIVEAYDFAGDQNEPELQTQIIDFGMRHYPDHAPIRVRSAYTTFSDGGDIKEVLEILESVPADMLLRQALEVHIALTTGEKPDEVKKRLEAIIAKHDRFTDEDMIRFLSTASMLPDGYEWMVQHVDALRKHTDYLPTLLYEMAVYAKENADPERAAFYIDELTNIEPFECDYWEMLADVHMTLGKYDLARQDVDYALAINPRSVRSRLFDANLRVIEGNSVTEVIDSISDLILSDELDSLPLFMALSAFDAAGMQERGRDLLTRFLEKYPQNKGALDMLIYRDPKAEATVNGIRRMLNDPDHQNEEFWNEWAEFHFFHSNFEGAVTILRVYLDSGRVLSDYRTYLLSLYLSNRPAEAVAYIFHEELVTTADPETIGDESPEVQATGLKVRIPAGSDPLKSRVEVIVLLVMGMLRTGGDEGAFTLIERELHGIHAMMEQGQLMRNVTLCGYREVLKQIRTQARKGVYPDSYDPLLMPNNLKTPRRKSS